MFAQFGFERSSTSAVACPAILYLVCVRSEPIQASLHSARETHGRLTGQSTSAIPLSYMYPCHIVLYPLYIYYIAKEDRMMEEEMLAAENAEMKSQVEQRQCKIAGRAKFFTYHVT